MRDQLLALGMPALAMTAPTARLSKISPALSSSGRVIKTRRLGYVGLSLYRNDFNMRTCTEILAGADRHELSPTRI